MNMKFLRLYKLGLTTIDRAARPSIKGNHGDYSAVMGDYIFGMLNGIVDKTRKSIFVNVDKTRKSTFVNLAVSRWKGDVLINSIIK